MGGKAKPTKHTAKEIAKKVRTAPPYTFLRPSQRIHSQTVFGDKARMRRRACHAWAPRPVHRSVQDAQRSSLCGPLRRAVWRAGV
jgi:hypothetical protein